MQTDLTRAEIIDRLAASRDELLRLKIASLRLFGSFGRDQPRPESDIDMLVEFEGPKTFRGYMGAKHFLEELLGRKVDLTTDEALRPEMKERIIREAVRVA